MCLQKSPIYAQLCDVTFSSGHLSSWIVRDNAKDMSSMIAMVLTTHYPVQMMQHIWKQTPVYLLLSNDFNKLQITLWEEI